MALIVDVPPPSTVSIASSPTNPVSVQLSDGISATSEVSELRTIRAQNVALLLMTQATLAYAPGFFPIEILPF